jgi:hypothetical protein
MIVLELDDLQAFVDGVIAKVNAGCLDATRRGIVVALPEQIDFEIQLVTDINRQIPTQLTESSEHMTEAGQGQTASQNASVEVTNQTETAAGGETSVETSGQTETGGSSESAVDHASQVESSVEASTQGESAVGAEQQVTNDNRNETDTSDYEEI